MRTRMLLAALTIGLGAGLTDATGEVVFSAGLEIHSAVDFYEPLTPCGTWVEVGHYGRCWRPVGVAVGWRPYCNGHWEWTDCGWYWVSDEPWAWACYHYGSWVMDPTYGWVWIPGAEWAPAWVTWRGSPDYIGWAPCGPGGVVLAPSLFVFVGVGHFHEHIRPGLVVMNDPVIIQHTTVINNFTRETRDFGGVRQRVVINQGPKVDIVQRATGARFTPRPIHEIVSQTPVPDTVRRLPAERGGISRPVQERPPATTGREQPRIYRESPQLPPTGREQPRMYREAPKTPTPAPGQPSRTPEHVVPQQPRAPVTPSQAVPERRRPDVPTQPILPPTGRERGRNEVPVLPREGVPPLPSRPPPHEAPGKGAGPPPAQERERGHGRNDQP
ncbi:MAG TPA: DUF6600 domain-containing protein [Candidatus Binatia bacterium]|jgi:hypothetical protein|nr:DUF6600 domain-containing protein [Candidatus Binatia bacterium]